MKQTPLFAAHQARNARIEPVGGWMLPAEYGHADAEVAAVRDRAGIVDLTHLGKVTLAGPDARRFCNGMFTNNVKKLLPGQGNRSAMTDDRGRVQGLLDLYCVADDRFLCVLDGVDAAWFEQRYQLYIVMDDVELATMDAAPWVLTVQGPAASGVLEALHLPVPVNDHDHAEVGGVRVCRKDRTGSGGWDLLLPDEALATAWEAAVAAGAVPVGHEALDALRIEAGMARWPQDGRDVTMVHELRLEKEVCAFDKGCYIGQEVINRIDVKGAIQRRLTGLVLGEDALPPAGAEVVRAGEAVGEVTSAARVRGRALVLAMLRRDTWDVGSEVVVRAGGRDVGAKVSGIPFA